jgi:hypothetical protein
MFHYDFNIYFIENKQKTSKKFGSMEIVNGIFLTCIVIISSFSIQNTWRV